MRGPDRSGGPDALQRALEAARETRALELNAGAIARVADVFKQHFPGCRALVIGDPLTMRIAGNAVSQQLKSAQLEFGAPVILSDPALYAEFKFVEVVEAALQNNTAIPVAVGSGTINDLVKLAAHRTGRSYLCVATAASMDGYTAFGASITFRGSKQTFDCPAPRAVVADIDIVRRAPARMTASGYADLLAKVTAGADWILADELGVEPIDPQPWEIVQGGLRDALANPSGAAAGETLAVLRLTEGLMLGGFAMQRAKSSRPASGAEHQFSHLWDMEHHIYQGVAPSHGFKVGIATLAVTAFYEQLLVLPLQSLNIQEAAAEWERSSESEQQIRARFHGTDFVERAVEESSAKSISRSALELQLQRLQLAWPVLVERLRAQLLPASDIQQRLREVGAPAEPEEIGISRSRLRESFIRAFYIRRRFTVLDVAMRSGYMNTILGKLFGPGGRWSVPSSLRRSP